MASSFLGSVVVWVCYAAMVIGFVTLIRYLFRTNERLAPSMPVILLACGICFSIIGYRVIDIEAHLTLTDASGHQKAAVNIARLLRRGDYERVAKYVAPGNPAYQLATGAFYYVTNAPAEVIIILNGGMAFLGQLLLLNSLSKMSKHPMPPYLTFLLTCLPTTWFWPSSHLKEGPMFFGICLMLAYMPITGRGRTLPFCIGTVIAIVLRPHMAIGWLAGVALGMAVGGKRSVQQTVVLVVAIAFSYVAVVQLIPYLIGQGGIQESIERLESDYMDYSSRGGGSAIQRESTPIPVLDGLLLLLFRPYPTDVFDLRSLAAGLEVWLVSGLAIWGWLSVPNRSKLLKSPYVVVSIGAILLLAFPFTYMYNMGLMVRQRLMVLPAMTALCVAPWMYKIHLQSLLTARPPRRVRRRKSLKPT